MANFDSFLSNLIFKLFIYKDNVDIKKYFSNKKKLYTLFFYH